jgi:hypothetical protein
VFADVPCRDFEANETESASESRLVSLLDVCTRWDIDAARDFAIKCLDKMEPKLTAVRRVELINSFSVIEWVPGVVREMLRDPMSKFDAHERAILGHEVLYILDRARERMEFQRRRIAQVPFAMEEETQDWRCSAENHARCIKAWKKLWGNEVWRKLFHPVHPIFSWEIQYEAKKWAHPDLNELCKGDVIEALSKKKFRDEDEMDKAVEEVVAYYKNCSPRYTGI